ncbi:Hypothetical protein HVR_LOCUS498 [uncultured virus]|nr:Hypothetical protein HVR_LOCUS498 [uncultured virus]
MIFPNNKLKLRVYITDGADLQGLTELSKGFANNVNKYKHQFGLANFDPDNAIYLRKAFYYPMNNDGEHIEYALA